MHMLKERLQIMVDRDQRRALDAEAKRRGVSVGSVVREAIDARLGGVERQRRIRAVEEMGSAATGRAPSQELIDRILDEERGAGGPRP